MPTKVLSLESIELVIAKSEINMSFVFFYLFFFSKDACFKSPEKMSATCETSIMNVVHHIYHESDGHIIVLLFD